jgi:N-glycosylase/DNA lyase
MSLESLISEVEKQKGGSLCRLVNARTKEFRALGRKSSDDIFKELCFCLLTANFSAEGGIRIQHEIGDGFLTLSEEELAKRLRRLGHRFPEARAAYIAGARQLKDEIFSRVGSSRDTCKLRDWIVENVKGLGYKEASHFLRNVGFGDVAIIDFHIIDLLQRHGLLDKPKSLTRKRYMEIELILKKLAKALELDLGELDLYLWCLETGRVLK